MRENSHPGMKIEVMLVGRAEARKKTALSCDNEKERKATMERTHNNGRPVAIFNLTFYHFFL